MTTCKIKKIKHRKRGGTRNRSTQGLSERIVPVQKVKIEQKDLICANEKNGFCYTFNRVGSNNLKSIFNGYTDVSLVKESEEVKSGSNGAITLITYENNGLKANAILKKINIYGSFNKDNLFYEYVIGTCFINRIKKCFPCFLETYAFYPSEGHEYLENKITQDMLEKSCDSKNFSEFAVLIEYVNDAETLAAFVSENSESEELVYILFQVYFALAVLRKSFTHYDLHLGNVMVYRPRPGYYIQYHYVFSDNTTVSFKSQYGVKIIDYGRCFFDNKTLFQNATYLTKQTDETIVSKYKEDTENKPFFESSNDLYDELIKIENCKFKKMNDKGYDEYNKYRAIKGYDRFLKKNENGVPNETTGKPYFDSKYSFGNYAYKNESHDLLLFERMYVMYDEERVFSFFELINDIIVEKKFSYYRPNGTLEDLESGIGKDKINNVYDACQKLADIIVSKLPPLYSDKTKQIGELTVYSDGREMKLERVSRNSTTK